jgi:hypothetical protein
MSEEIYRSKDSLNLLKFRLGYIAFMGLFFTKRSKSHYSSFKSLNIKVSGFKVPLLL